MKPVIINIKVAKLRKMGYNSLVEWLEEPSHMYIGRTVHYVEGANASPWANPYSVKAYGLKECLERYEKHVRDNLWDRLAELDGKVLGCWCKTNNPDEIVCHGDVLVRLFQERFPG